MDGIARSLVDGVLKTTPETIIKLGERSADTFVKVARKLQKVKLIITSRFDHAIGVQLPACENGRHVQIQKRRYHDFELRKKFIGVNNWHCKVICKMEEQLFKVYGEGIPKRQCYNYVICYDYVAEHDLEIKHHWKEGWGTSAPNSEDPPASEDVRVHEMAKKDPTSIHQATEDGNDKLLDSMLQIGVDVNAPANCKEISSSASALHIAAYFGHEKCVEVLLNHEASIDEIDSEGWTPLHYACANGHVKVVKLLLEKGADIHAKNEDGHTPLDYARGDRRPEVKSSKMLLHGLTWKPTVLLHLLIWTTITIAAFMSLSVEPAINFQYFHWTMRALIVSYLFARWFTEKQSQEGDWGSMPAPTAVLLLIEVLLQKQELVYFLLIDPFSYYLLLFSYITYHAYDFVWRYFYKYQEVDDMCHLVLFGLTGILYEMCYKRSLWAIIAWTLLTILTRLGWIW